MGQVVFVTSGKGGTGKSSVSVGLGAALALRGRRTLLIDGDAGLRSLDIMMGVADQVVYDLNDVFDGRCEPIRAIVESSVIEGFSLLPAPSSSRLEEDPADMRRLCRGLARYFDMVLIDSPAGVGPEFSICAAAADRAFVVALPDPVCIRSAERVGRLLQSAGVSDRRLIINRYDPSVIRNGLVTDLDEVIDRVGLQLLGVIPEDGVLRACFSRGAPLEEKSPAGAAFARLAARLDGEKVPIGIY